MDDKTGVHGLLSKWRAEANQLRLISRRFSDPKPGEREAQKIEARADALDAALRQSGEAVYQFGAEGCWRDIDKQTFDWWMNQGSLYCRLLYTTPPATSGLVEALLVVRDVLAASPIDCLGEDEAADGMPYPIRDEVIDRISKALAAHDARGG